MDRIRYRIAYWLGKAKWDSGITPPEVIQAFQSGSIAPGTVIDLGCGTGTNVIFMAKQGRQAIGLDFVPEAIHKARLKARRAGVSSRTEFRVADVSRLVELELPQVAFALDMGCFHGLKAESQRRYAEGLAKILVPGGLYMLYTLDPAGESGSSVGVLPETVEAVFSPWCDIQKVERGAFGSRSSTWFWMIRKAG